MQNLKQNELIFSFFSFRFTICIFNVHVFHVSGNAWSHSWETEWKCKTKMHFWPILSFHDRGVQNIRFWDNRVIEYCGSNHSAEPDIQLLARILKRGWGRIRISQSWKNCRHGSVYALQDFQKVQISIKVVVPYSWMCSPWIVISFLRIWGKVFIAPEFWNQKTHWPKSSWYDQPGIVERLCSSLCFVCHFCSVRSSFCSCQS